MTSSHLSLKCRQCIDWDASETVSAMQINVLCGIHQFSDRFLPDIVFFIFLYQRWIYKVDKSRVNEFGFSGEMEEEVKKKALTPGDASTPQAIAENEATPPKPEEDKKRD